MIFIFFKNVIFLSHPTYTIDTLFFTKEGKSSQEEKTKQLNEHS